MEVDTGATMSLMSANTLYRLWPGRKVQTTKVRLCSYSKEPIPVVGCCEVNINYKGQKYATNWSLETLAIAAGSLLKRVLWRLRKNA